MLDTLNFCIIFSLFSPKVMHAYANLLDNSNISECTVYSYFNSFIQGIRLYIPKLPWEIQGLLDDLDATLYISRPAYFHSNI